MTIERATVIKPMLCQLAETPFNSPDYIWEPKLDGERLVTVVKNGKVAAMYARSGREKAYMYPDLKLDTKLDCVLDGEVVSLDNTFNGIQHRANRQNGIAQAIKDYPVKYSVFDIIAIAASGNELMPIGGFDLMKRKEILKATLNETENVVATAWCNDGVGLFDLMKANKLEGVVGKEIHGKYHENKREWLKVKCWQEGTFMAVGYTAGTGWRAASFGALVLADAKQAYVGSVGSGFNEATIKSLMKSFSAGACPWQREPEQATWVKPFPVKIRFLEYTNDGMLRFPAFKGVV